MGRGSAFTTLLGSNLKRWMGAKGFSLVVLAALFPVALTGAWVATHQDDVAATTLTWTPDGDLVEGANVTFTATVRNEGDSRTDAFNASLSIGRVTGNTLRPDATETVEVGALDAGEEQTLTLQWTAKPGGFYVLAFADAEDAFGEMDETNNQKAEPVVVGFAAPTEDTRPAAPGNLTGDDANSTARADLVVTSIVVPEGLKNAENGTVTATVRNDGPDAVENATLVLRVGQSFNGEVFPSAETTETLALGAGESREVTLDWPNAFQGAYWAEAYVITPNSAHDPDAENNHRAEPVVVQPPPPPAFEPPVEQATIKEFYVLILSFLHLPVLIPFIALFYAGGVLSDERDGGSLTYLLTRPFPRWFLPVAKFTAGFAVSAVAVVVGLALSFVVLFGQPGAGNVGFLTTPLLVSLVALLVYGAFFVLLAVIVDRPYLVGVAFILGWEVVAATLVPWVSNLTIRYHVGNAIAAWPVDEGVLLLPPDAEGVRAVVVVIGAALAFVVASGYWIQRREFPD